MAEQRHHETEIVLVAIRLTSWELRCSGDDGRLVAGGDGVRAPDWRARAAYAQRQNPGMFPAGRAQRHTIPP